MICEQKKDTTSEDRAPQVRQKKSEENTTKIEPITGFLEARYVTCGKPNCKCANGQLHGPYFCRRWLAGGDRRSKYVRKADIADVKEGISAFKQKRKSRRMQRGRGNDLLRMLKMIRREQMNMLKSGLNGGL